MLYHRLTVGLVALAMCLVLTAGSAFALTFDDVLVSESYGSGSDSAMCIIDFGPKSFAFRYDFSGPQTGLSMILALDAPNTGLDVTYTDWGEYGVFVDDFAYHNQAKRTTIGPYSGWNYWTSIDGVNWVSSMVGAGRRSLTAGSWDAWSYTGFDGDTGAPTAPPPVTPVPVEPVPEPSSLAALAAMLGLAAPLRFAVIRKS